jgi:hypothetical protein
MELRFQFLAISGMTAGDMENADTGIISLVPIHSRGICGLLFSSSGLCTGRYVCH